MEVDLVKFVCVYIIQTVSCMLGPRFSFVSCKLASNIKMLHKVCILIKSKSHTAIMNIVKNKQHFQMDAC